MSETVVLVIEEGQQRKRLESTPLINGIENECPEDREMNLIEVEHSRERKRSRTDMEITIRKMEILKGVKDEQYDTCLAETRVISGLVENVEEEKAKLLIECFNPIIRNFPDHIKQEMMKCSHEWENKKEMLEATINYVAHGRENVMEIVKQLLENDVETLIEMLIREIENRMPKHCRKCDEWYMVKLTDSPQIHCMWCKVGMHDCVEMKDNIGIKWLCEKCDPVFTKHIQPKLDRAAFFEGFSDNDKVPKHTEKRKSKETVVIEHKNKVSEEQMSINKEDEDIAIIEEVTIENDNESKAKKDQARVVTNDNNKVEDKEVCWFWKNRKCRYENNCKKEHPEQCKAMIEEGRCKNNRCKLIHPKICRNSFYKGYCNRGDSCWFVHPKKCNNQQINVTNLGNSWGNNQDRHNQQTSFNQNWGNQNQLQNNTNKNFLEQWPQIGNNYNTNNQMWRGSENQAMMQMMENMMQKVMGMESKIMRIETGWQFNRR